MLITKHITSDKKHNTLKRIKTLNDIKNVQTRIKNAQHIYETKMDLFNLQESTYYNTLLKYYFKGLSDLFNDNFNHQVLFYTEYTEWGIYQYVENFNTICNNIRNLTQSLLIEIYRTLLSEPFYSLNILELVTRYNTITFFLNYFNTETMEKILIPIGIIRKYFPMLKNLEKAKLNTLNMLKEKYIMRPSIIDKINKDKLDSHTKKYIESIL
jgi:hypothetical protein